MSSEFFSARPPKHVQKKHHPVIRSGKKYGLALQGLCISDRVICAPTHYAGRTIPCLTHLGKLCHFCNQGHMPRWLGYLAILEQRKKIKGLLELTHNAAEIAARFAEEKGSLRGWVIAVSRIGDKPNGILEVKFGHANLDPDQIPEGLNVAEALSEMWRLQRQMIEATPAGIPVEELAARGQLDEDVYMSNGKASA